jgi:hypothetical protein
MKRECLHSASWAVARVLFCVAVASIANTQEPAQLPQLPQQINQFLTAKHTPTQPLAGLGGQFVTLGEQYGVDPRLVVAISGAESSFGAHVCTQSNAWNWFWEGPCPKSPFDSWESGAKTVTHFLHKSYLLKGYKTIPLIGAKYCASGCEHWVPNVTEFFTDLGGNPSQLSWSIVSIPAPAAAAPAQIIATLTSHSVASQHWWQKSASETSVNVQATITGEMPRLGSVKLVRVAADGQHELATLRAEGTDDYGATVFSGQASLPELQPGELRMQVIAAFAHAKAAVVSNPLSLTIVSPPASVLPWVLGITGAGTLVLMLVVGFMILRRRVGSVTPAGHPA